ncbi:GNAT family N-acetyltransferase [Streptomyces sp. NPDC005899]|uniref:GNAT family N-acetyltransferase n=1 Tax=Streptomyces sp. NPDC005899 TaxID=3155716 RepID=UPI0034083ECF
MGVRVRRADERDRGQVVRIMEEAFHHDPVSAWVFPDEAHRRAVHGRFLGAFADAALDGGWIDLLEDGTATALWLSVPADAPEEDDTPARMREVTDPGNERVELVGRLSAEAHPRGRAHVYLLMIGVSPERQGEGIGEALVSGVLDRCDRDGVPAYLEASSERSRRLYERLGFRLLGRGVDLPDGPSMWPMWRDPHTG